MDTITKTKMITAADAGVLTGLPITTLKKWSRDGLFRYYVLGGKINFDRAELLSVVGEGRLMSSDEVARLVGVRIFTLRNWADAGKIPCVRFVTAGGKRNGKRYFREADVRKLVEERKPVEERSSESRITEALLAAGFNVETIEVSRTTTNGKTEIRYFAKGSAIG